MEFLTDLYPWTKALHIISVIAWMAAQLYLPRLFVYHADVPVGSEMSETFKIMERRLARAIMTPAMILTWLFGLALLGTPGLIDWSTDIWMHVKIVLVLALSAVHGILIKRMKEFAADQNTRSSRHYRLINEVPTVFMIAVVILVVVRPF